MRGNEEYHFYHLDEQNSTVYITGQAGDIKNRYQYDAFGAIREQQEGLPNRILYTGQQYDQTSEQYYLRARYYNPAVGRFLQEDVYRGDGLNLYAYCRNNPVIYFDPSGYGKREQYMGGTLRLNSPGGRIVLDTMYKEGGLNISNISNKALITRIEENGF